MDAPNKQGRILVLDEDQTLLASTCEAIRQDIAGSSVVGVASVAQCREALGAQSFDLIILDHTLSGGAGVELIHEAKVQDYEPGILVVSPSEDPRAVASIFNLGCLRYIVKNGDWLAELGPAIRSAMRVKKLELENQVLIGKLTEANRLLDDKNKRLDEFSATVSHDIRGVLGGLGMRLEYIIDVSRDSLSGKLLSLIEHAKDATERVQEIVQNTYDFSKLGAEAVKKGDVDLSSTVSEVIDDLQFDEKLNIRIGLDDLPIVYGCKPLLQRVFINLISNAVKYNDKSEIVINIGVERVFENGLGRFCDVFVEDNGRGIDEEHLPHIFKMFWQDHNNARGECGTGIGLAVVKRIAELHLGDVTARSTKGEGSRFIVSLPLEEISFV